MKKIFNLTPAQTRIVVFLSTLLLVLSVLRFIRGYAAADRESVQIRLGSDEERDDYRSLLRIDLNHSPADSLELLPGIGPVLASRIVAYRDSSKFGAPEEILRINGIGPATYEKIKPYLHVGIW